MFNIKSLATMAAAATLISPVVGVFDANSNANMVVYWVSQRYGQSMDVSDDEFNRAKDLIKSLSAISAPTLTSILSISPSSTNFLTRPMGTLDLTLGTSVAMRHTRIRTAPLRNCFRIALSSATISKPASRLERKSFCP